MGIGAWGGIGASTVTADTTVYDSKLTPTDQSLPHTYRAEWGNAVDEITTYQSIIPLTMAGTAVRLYAYDGYFKCALSESDGTTTEQTPVATGGNYPDSAGCRLTGDTIMVGVLATPSILLHKYDPIEGAEVGSQITYSPKDVTDIDYQHYTKLSDGNILVTFRGDTGGGMLWHFAIIDEDFNVVLDPVNYTPSGNSVNFNAVDVVENAEGNLVFFNRGSNSRYGAMTIYTKDGVEVIGETDITTTDEAHSVNLSIMTDGRYLFAYRGSSDTKVFMIFYDPISKGFTSPVEIANGVYTTGNAYCARAVAGNRILCVWALNTQESGSYLRHNLIDSDGNYIQHKVHHAGSREKYTDLQPGPDGTMVYCNGKWIIRLYPDDATLLGSIDTSNFSNPPTTAELDSAYGSADKAGTGFMKIINDNGGNTKSYIVLSDGTNWHVYTGTAAA
jgi:hypothetical protein